MKANRAESARAAECAQATAGAVPALGMAAVKWWASSAENTGLPRSWRAQQGIGDPVMQIQPARRCQGRVDGLPVQVVDEAGRTVVWLGRSEDAGRCGFGGQRVDLVRFVACHLGEHVG